MPRLTLESIETLLVRESDYTVRLLKSGLSPSKKYVFSLLRFNSNNGLWNIRLVDQAMTVTFEENKADFWKAKETLILQMKRLVEDGFKITVIASGFYVPSFLRRKRKKQGRS